MVRDLENLASTASLVGVTSDQRLLFLETSFPTDSEASPSAALVLRKWNERDASQNPQHHSGCLVEFPHTSVEAKLSPSGRVCLVQEFNGSRNTLGLLRLDSVGSGLGGCPRNTHAGAPGREGTGPSEIVPVSGIPDGNLCHLQWEDDSKAYFSLDHALWEIQVDRALARKIHPGTS